MPHTPRVAVIGDALIDEIHDGAEVRELVGGAALNVAVGLRRLGVETTLVAMLGDDGAGAQVRAHLAAHGVRLVATPAPNGSSRAFVTRGADGEPEYGFNRAARERSIRWTPEARDAVAEADLVAISCFPFDDVAEVTALRAALGGCRVVIDPNPRSGMLRDPAAFVAGFEGLVPDAALIKVGQDDASLLYDGDLPALTARLRAEGAPAVLATAGRDGAVVDAVGIRVHAPISDLPGPIVDTVGAGDATLAAVVAVLVGGAPQDAEGWRALLVRAMDVAAATCRGAGGLLRTPESLAAPDAHG